MTHVLQYNVPAWVAVVVFIIGMLGGFMIQLGWYEMHGRRVLVPVIAKSTRNFTIMAIALGLVSFITVIQVQVSAARSDRCEEQLRTALAYNVEITDVTRDIEKLERAARDEGRQALGSMLRTLVARIAADPPPTMIEVANIYSEYTTVAGEVTVTLAQLDDERDRVNAQRAPYPEPTCGS